MILYNLLVATAVFIDISDKNKKKRKVFVPPSHKDSTTLLCILHSYFYQNTPGDTHVSIYLIIRCLTQFLKHLKNVSSPEIRPTNCIN